MPYEDKGMDHEQLYRLNKGKLDSRPQRDTWCAIASMVLIAIICAGIATMVIVNS